MNGKYYDTEAIQNWLTKTLHEPMPCAVDSAAIAGMIDLLKCQGCFALAARYAVCFKMPGGSKDVDPMDPNTEYPTIWDYEEIGMVFEKALSELVEENEIKSLEMISCYNMLRVELVNKVQSTFAVETSKTLQHNAFANFVSLDIEEGDLGKFVQATVNAFFDNDLLHSTRIFLENAKGSFGLCVTTSIEAHRQVCIAAKGQTNSVAFYPRKGIICYGSEQAAVKVSVYDVLRSLY